jgi:hypothetical protein
LALRADGVAEATTADFDASAQSATDGVTPQERCHEKAITLPDDLEQALERFVAAQSAPVQPTAVVQAAVREYLAERGYLPSTSSLRIRPAPRGSDNDDVSVSQDRYLASS